jgi:hypothetical protein
VLPELVAAAKHITKGWEKHLIEPMTRLDEVVAIAETINNRKNTMKTKSINYISAKPLPRVG